MKQLIRILITLVAVVLAAVCALVVTVFLRSNAKLSRLHDVPRGTISVVATPANIANGKHVAVVRGCTGCHGSDLGGGQVIKSGAMGLVYAPNLTRGQGGLPESFVAEDFERAVRHGLTPEGRGLLIMPSTDYASISSSDMNDLIAYLQSLPAVDRENVPISVGPVTRALLVAGKMKLAADVIDHAAIHPTEVQPGVTAEYGRYLAQTCMGCHGENLSGGKIAAGPPDWPPAANLTPDAAGRLKTWQEADFIRTIRTHVRPDGTALNEVMPRVFGKMTDDELKALWMYLQTLPAAPTGSHA